MALEKTRAMAQIELEDALVRNGRRRDIRDILDDCYAETGSVAGAAELLPVTPAALHQWMNGPLKGSVAGKGAHTWLHFEGFETARERAARLAAEEEAAELAGVS